MGPQATNKFYELVIKRSCELGAKKNEDYPHMLISNLPVPDFISGRDKDSEGRAIDTVLNEVDRLQKVGATFLVIPCNTMHLHMKIFRQGTIIPIVSMIDEVNLQILQRGYKKVALLGSKTTMNIPQLYINKLMKFGIEVFVPDSLDQYIIGNIILKIISGKTDLDDKKKIIKIIDKLKLNGAEAIILGCTEIPLILDDDELLLNSLDILANAVCARVYEEKERWQCFA